MGPRNDFGRHQEEMRDEMAMMNEAGVARQQAVPDKQKQEPLPPEVARAFRAPGADGYANS